MAPNWLKMNRNRIGGWRASLYQNPIDRKLIKDKKLLKAMVKDMVGDHLSGRSHLFEDLELANSLLSRLRLFLHLYLSLSTSVNKNMEVEALSILNELNTERIQLQALSIWSVSNSTDAPAKWKNAQRRKGVSAMPWRAAVSFAEQSQFAFDQHWVSQYRYDNALHLLAQNFGGLSEMGAGLRNSDPKVRAIAVEKMGAWLHEVGAEGEALFRIQSKLACKKRFNVAAIDASERTLEIARRVALKRAPDLAKSYYAYKSRETAEANDEVSWHDRYAMLLSDEDVKAWKTVKSELLKNLSALPIELNKVVRQLLISEHLIQPKGRGGGFTTPVFYSRKGKVEAGPLIYAPFDGGKDSARTLAHEMGHGVHAYLSSALGPMQSDAGWAVAETVALVFERLNMQDDINSLVDQDFAMLVHQPAIGMFERELGVAEPHIPADAIWLNALRSHYGETISLKGYGPFWRRHSSTISAPGYPMAYLLGWTLAAYVCDRPSELLKKTGQSLTELLKAGGNVGFDEAAAMLGARNVEELFHRAYDRAESRLNVGCV